MSSLKKSILFYLFASVALLLLFNYYSFTSPRGFPLKPFDSYYDINDFSFYSSYFEMILSEGYDFKPGPIFPSIIYLSDLLFPQGGLTVLFIIFGVFYIYRLNYFFGLAGRSSDICLFIFSPYFYYFSIFPSSDFIGSIILLEYFIILFRFFEVKRSVDYFNDVLIVRAILVVCLACAARPNLLGFFIPVMAIPAFEFLHRGLANKEWLWSRFSLFLISFSLFVLFLQYYSAGNVYISTSTEYLAELDYVGFAESIVGKFLSSFGLRESYFTSAGSDFTKNTLYIFVRICFGCVLLFGYLLSFFYMKKYSSLVLVLHVAYLQLLLVAFSGVNFERYFISVYPLMLQFLVIFYKDVQSRIFKVA